MAKSGGQRSKACRDRLRGTKSRKKASVDTKLRRGEYNLRKKTVDSQAIESSSDPLCLFTSTEIEEQECVAAASTNTRSLIDYNTAHTDFHSADNNHEISTEKHFDDASGRTCCICDRIWFIDTSNTSIDGHEQSMHGASLNSGTEVTICDSCKQSSDENNVSKLIKSDDSDPLISTNSPPWDLVSERLLEKWISNEKMETSTLDYGTQFDNFNSIAEGVSVSQNKDNDSTNIATHNMDVAYRQINTVSLNIQGIGEICAGECRLPNGEIIIKAYVYILPNQPVMNIIDFIYFNLLPYTVVGASLLHKNFDKIPMILSGNFNIDFESEDAQPLIEFMSNKFSLQLDTDPKTMTTKSYSSIDAVFQRYLDRLKSTVLVSYFDEEKPIVSYILPDNLKGCE